MQCRSKKQKKEEGLCHDLRLAEVRKHGVDELERLVDLLTNFRLRKVCQHRCRAIHVCLDQTLLTPVSTILPETKMRSTIFGFIIR